MSTSVPTATGRSGFRQVLTPLGSTKKRKDRNTLEAPQPPPHAIFSPRHPPNKTIKTEPQPPPLSKPKPKTATTGGGNNNNNLVFAGYLAHEYLRRGTLMGQSWNPTAADLSGEEEEEGGGDDGMRIYNDLSGLVMGERSGAHITDIVNPTELSRCIGRRP